MFYATHQFEVKFSKILRGEGGGGLMMRGGGGLIDLEFFCRGLGNEG